MHNLELKVRCPDDAALAALAATARAQGAVFLRTMFQRDTYFAAPRGRLKLREWRREAGERGAVAAAEDAEAGERGAVAAAEDAEAGERGAVLIAYDRPDETGSRVSDYLLCPVGDPDALRAALARSVGARLVVEKRRGLWMWGHTRIHLDRVVALGPFVELETVVEHFPGTEGERQAAAEEEHRRVIALLGLARFPAIAGSYSDLLVASA